MRFVLLAATALALACCSSSCGPKAKAPAAAVDQCTKWSCQGDELGEYDCECAE